LYKKKLNIGPLEEDTKEIGIIFGNFEYPLVSRSDGPLAEGMPVRLDMDTAEDSI